MFWTWLEAHALRVLLSTSTIKLPLLLLLLPDDDDDILLSV